MAYNYPYTAQPLYPQTMNPMQSNAYPTQMSVSPTQQSVGQPQIQDGGFVTIPNADMVYSYPVAMGKCVTFKVEGKPLIIEKSMGFSQLDSPKIERYRLVKEEAEDVESGASEDVSEVESMKEDIIKIWGEINEIKANSRKSTPKRESKDGES